MIVRCCPQLEIDTNGPTPEDENPRWKYLVIKNLRAKCITTRELLIALLDKHGEPVKITFQRTGHEQYAAFLAYRSVPQLLKVAEEVPDIITRREVKTLLANSKFFPNEGDTTDLVRHYCQLNEAGAFFSRSDMRLFDD